MRALSKRLADLFGFRRQIQVCYAVSADADQRYVDLVVISALAVKRIYPAAKITVLTDDQSLPLVSSLLDRYGLARKVRSTGKYVGPAGARSRFVKTQARTVVDGDFLYLDADAIPVARFDKLFRSKGPVCAAIDRSPKAPAGSGFPSWAEAAFQRLGWPYPPPHYLNGGVVFWRDTPITRRLGRLWHENWLRFYNASDDYADQPSFNYSLSSLGIVPQIMHDKYNARVGLRLEFADQASIYHFYASDNGTPGSAAVDELLSKFRDGAALDLLTIRAALVRSHRSPLMCG
jgi:hypothetical protein